MIISEDLVHQLKFAYAGLLIFVAILDHSVILIAKKRTDVLKNKYLEIHHRYGFLKTSLIKIFIVAVVLIGLLMPVPSASKSLLGILVYAFFVIKLIKDLIKPTRIDV